MSAGVIGCVVFSFICEGENILNTFNNNRSNFSPFIKGAKICILFIKWYTVLFVFFMISQCSPMVQQSEFINPREITHEGVDSPLVSYASLFGEYQTAILTGLEKRLQLWIETYNEGLCILSSRFNFLSGICENVVEANRNQDQKQSGQRNWADGEYPLCQAFFLLVIIPFIAAVISIFYTQRPN